MTSLRSLVRRYGTVGRVSLRNRMAYMGNFAGSLLTYGLFIYIFSRLWATALGPGSAAEGGRVIAGYDRPMLVWYFIVAEISVFGFGRFFWTLSADMKNGQVAYLLTRPYSFVGYHYAERMGPALVESGLFLLEGSLLGLAFGGPFPIRSVIQGGMLLVSLVLAGSVQFFFQMAIAMTAFWFEENSAFFWIFQKFALIVGTLLPLEFLPEKAARLALWTPFPYFSYAPGRIAVAYESGEAWTLMAVQLLWVLVGHALAWLVFRLGARKISVQGG